MTRGIIRLGEIVEIKPGILSKNEEGKHVVQNLYSRIVSLKTETNDLLYAVPGGLIGVGLKVDPFLTAKSKLSSHVGEIRYKEVLLVNVGSTSIPSLVIDISGENKDIVKFSLSPPTCAEIGETVAFSRKLGHSWRLIGWGKVLEGGETI